MTQRLENALTKLYKAYHEGTLQAQDCKHCAVGNIVEGEEWSDVEGFDYFDGGVSCPKGLSMIKKSGYSIKELKRVESIFIFHGWSKINQFKGLCKVVEYLCELDNVPNVMDCTKIFETTEEGKPKHELELE